MAGIFNYIGKIFTEKNGFFKVVSITLLATVIASLQETFMKSLGAGQFAGASLVLLILLSALTTGYSLQIYSNKMRKMPNVLPEFDFVGMFIATIKFIPFWLVWTLYLVIFSVACAMILPSVGVPSAPVIIAFLLMIIVITILYGLSWPCLIALHTKNFTYKHVLNILAPVQIYSKVAGEMAKLFLKVFGLSLVILAVFYIFAFLIGVSTIFGSADVTSVTQGVSGFNLRFLLTMFIFAQTILNYAYVLCVCDITLEKLSETKYLPESYDYTPEQNTTPKDDLDL